MRVPDWLWTCMLCCVAVIWATMLVTVVYLSHGSRTADPLAQLERQALAHPSYTASVDTSSDDTFYWSAKRLEAILEQQLGAHVSYGDPAIPMSPDFAGMTIMRTRHVIINPESHWTTRFETLTHEAAHLLQPAFESRMDEEVFAEAVSCLVATHDGDTGALQRSAHYLSGVKSSLHVLHDYRAEILRAAAFLE